MLRERGREGGREGEGGRVYFSGSFGAGCKSTHISCSAIDNFLFFASGLQKVIQLNFDIKSKKKSFRQEPIHTHTHTCLLY